MKRREHFFKELKRKVITVSDYMETFDEYILCFKKNQLNEPKRIYYLCKKEKIESNEIPVYFLMAGLEELLNNELIINLNSLYNQTSPHPSSQIYSKDEWVFENY
jgi:hypothetical protein